MYCDQCGAELRNQQQFCHSCGKSFATKVPPVAPERRGRVSGNLKTLGILWMVYSAFHLIPGMFFATLLPFGMARHAAFGWGPQHFLPGAIVGSVGAFFFFTSILGVIAGWGLLERKPWARTLAIFFGIFALFNFPFGTALGIYTLWVLGSSDAGREYQQAA